KAGIDTTKTTAGALGIELQLLEVRQPDNLAGAFSALTPWRPGGLLVLSDPVFGSQLARLAKLAAAQRLPAIYLRRGLAAPGGRAARLRPELCRQLSAGRHLRGQDPQGDEARGSARGATDQVRSRRQPEDGQGFRPHSAPGAARPGGSDHPVATSRASVSVSS